MPHKDISNSNIEIRITKQYQMTKIRMPETLRQALTIFTPFLRF